MIYSTLGSLFTGICDAIREKDGTTALISHQQIPYRIASISSCKNGELFSIPQANEVFIKNESYGAVCRYLIRNNEPYLALRKSFGFAHPDSGYDSGIFRYVTPIDTAGYESIKITHILGNDGGDVTARAYITIADSVPEPVKNVRYDFSGWKLIGDTKSNIGNATESTVTVPLEDFVQRQGNLYIGVWHGDESTVFTAILGLTSIILS